MTKTLRKEGIEKNYLNLINSIYKNLQQSESESRSAVSNSLRPHGLYTPWNSPGQNTGVGSLSLF